MKHFEKKTWHNIRQKTRFQDETVSDGCTIDEVLVVGDDMDVFKDAVTAFDCGVSTEQLLQIGMLNLGISHATA